MEPAHPRRPCPNNEQGPSTQVAAEPHEYYICMCPQPSRARRTRDTGHGIPQLAHVSHTTMVCAAPPGRCTPHKQTTPKSTATTAPIPARAHIAPRAASVFLRSSVRIATATHSVGDCGARTVRSHGAHWRTHVYPQHTPLHAANTRGGVRPCSRVCNVGTASLIHTVEAAPTRGR